METHEMIHAQRAFCGLSVDNLTLAKSFYTDVLGLTLRSDTMGLDFELPGGGRLFIYLKNDHRPADFTVLNLVVTNIDETVNKLTSQRVTFEMYDMPYPQDASGILRGLASKQGPDIAWLKDPAGNIFAILQES
jgi:predicted enzyme related to lactoylglutathione lyase